MGIIVADLGSIWHHLVLVVPSNAVWAVGLGSGGAPEKVNRGRSPDHRPSKLKCDSRATFISLSLSSCFIPVKVQLHLSYHIIDK